MVDDSALMRRVLGTILAEDAGFDLAFARDGREAIAMVHSFDPDVVTLDVQMPEMDGIACLDRIMVEHPCRVLMLSSLTEAGAEVTMEALALGAVDFIAKPSGAISLALEEFGPRLRDKVRSTAEVRLRRSARLADRVRFRLRGSAEDGSLARTAAGKPVAPPRSWAGGEAVVLVGCSTGGPPALDALLAPLPADFPWPVVVAQHMPAAFTGSLARRLGGYCALDVVEVTQPMPLVPGRVFIGRGDADVILSRRVGGLVVMPAPASAEYRWHPSVDRLVASARRHLPAGHLVGVLMTGMGNDGAAEMARMRAAGGRTIAEAEETAVVWGMPGELVRLDGADVVAKLPSIAAQLLAWAA